MGLIGLLSLYIDGQNKNVIAPPFLPLSGIMFSFEIALAAQNLFYSTEMTRTLYLKESLESILSPFIHSSLLSTKKCLSTGLFPCYNLYKLQDDAYVAFAPIEEKYFTEFCKLFNLELPPFKRFDTTGEVFKILTDLFSNLRSEEFSKKIQGHDLCVSLVKPLRS